MRRSGAASRGAPVLRKGLLGTVTASANHKVTVAYAKLALGKMQALRAPCDPRSFAAWFTYATRCSPSHNVLVNRTIVSQGSISAAEVETIYGYAPADVIADNVQWTVAGAIDELGQDAATMDATAGTVAGYRDDLSRLVRELAGADDRERVGAIVDGLIQATRSMEASTEAFTAALEALRQEVGEAREKAQTLRVDSLTDALTQLANRACFERDLDRCMVASDATNEGLCLLLMDIDHLGKINTSFGHTAGDEVLRVVAHSLKQHVQQNDVAARIGGEEFAVLLPKIPLRAALTVGDHIRCRVMAMQFIKRSTGESMGRVTLSGGIARYRRGESPWELMRRADQCLTAAKRHGRNRVIC